MPMKGSHTYTDNTMTPMTEAIKRDVQIRKNVKEKPHLNQTQLA